MSSDSASAGSSSWLPRLGPQARGIFAKLRRALGESAGGVTQAEAMTTFDPQRYFDPAILAKVGFSPLLARVVVEGFINGLHKSPFHGFSVEFADHREYVPGDDLKFLDWHLYARTDHYYIKRFEEETNLRCTILLDRSASMGFGTGKLTKWDYSCFLASCLAYLMLRQQDAAGLALFGAAPGLVVQPRCRRTHLRQLMKAMMDHAPSGTTNVSLSLQAISQRLKRRGLVVVISDLIDEPEATLRALRMLSSRRHDVVVFHVQDAAETSFPFEGAALFQDLETGEEIEIDPVSVRKSYLERMQALTAFYRKGLNEMGADYHLIDTTQPYEQALSAYLNRRTKIRK
ncbi:MAG: DUF58 domain-containing protein [Planctomycetia bacterium]|nr:DUF58 domain-containing protein [Planctomycetia bacterium]